MQAGWLTLPEGRVETGWWGPGPADAPTIVMLHEGLGCVALWRDVPEQLAAATGLGVFAYSRFGYGQSDPVPLPRPMTYMHHEAQIVLPQVLAAAGVRDTVLVGHSDGGSIAAIYAGTPSVVGEGPSGRVMVGEGPLSTALPRSAPQGVDGRHKAGHDVGAAVVARARAGAAAVAGEGSRAGSEVGAGAAIPRLHALITIAAHYFVEDLNIASIREIRASYETGDLQPRLARYHRDPDIAFHGWNGAWLDPRFRAFDITGFLPVIRVPTLGLQGADDPYGTDAQLQIMRAHMTAPVETRLIPHARHAPHLEAKAATLDAISGFIRTHIGQLAP